MARALTCGGHRTYPPRTTGSWHLTRSSELYYGRGSRAESPRSLATGDTQSYATAASLDQLLLRPKTGESVSTVDTARTTDSDQIKHFVIETLQVRVMQGCIVVVVRGCPASPLQTACRSHACHWLAIATLLSHYGCRVATHSRPSTWRPPSLLPQSGHLGKRRSSRTTC